MLNKKIYYFYQKYIKKFPGTTTYWENRFRRGKHSGAGSFGRLAAFKAETINQFVKENNIQSVIELGCGAGRQLQLMQYPAYIGLDVSETAVKKCRDLFSGDSSKRFSLYEPYLFTETYPELKAELALSLDVIYHLVEDEFFELYMRHLFRVAEKYVVIYSSNRNGKRHFHQHHRKFTDWVEENAEEWKLVEVLKNKYPYDSRDSEGTSVSDFYFYKIINHSTVR